MKAIHNRRNIGGVCADAVFKSKDTIVVGLVSPSVLAVALVSLALSGVLNGKVDADALFRISSTLSSLMRLRKWTSSLVAHGVAAENDCSPQEYWYYQLFIDFLKAN